MSEQRQFTYLLKRAGAGAAFTSSALFAAVAVWNLIQVQEDRKHRKEQGPA